MFLSHWLIGVLVGLTATLPLGPVGILIVQRTLNRGRKAAFYSGLGAALSDIFYASLTGFGMVIITAFLRKHEFAFNIAGSLILLLLGVFIMLSHPERMAAKKTKKRQSHAKYIAGTFMIAFTNPYIVFWYLALFSGFEIVLSIDNLPEALATLSGFLCGDVLFWFLLTTLVNLTRHWFNLKILLYFNRIAGGLIVLFSIGFLIKVLIEILA